MRLSAGGASAPRRLRLRIVRAILACAVVASPGAILVRARTICQVAPSPPAAAPASSKTWIGRADEIEAFLRAADIERVEELKIGVTRPRRAYLKPGGPIESMVWKPLKPGMHNGFWDSYKAEIAAYEMDKLLHLEMVPPTVERKVGRETGAAIMWVTPTRMWQMGETDAPKTAHWTLQVTRMKMFDDLIGNTDRNAGNLLVDPAWNVILIDHSRGFTSGKDLPSRLSRFDPDLWGRMQRLTAEDVTAAVAPWIGKDALQDILVRRAAMEKVIAELALATGEPAVR